MAVDQDDFIVGAVDLHYGGFMTEAKQVFCETALGFILTAALHHGEGLKSFALQAIQYGTCGDVCVAI